MQIKTRTRYAPTRHTKDSQDRHLSASPNSRTLATPDAGDDAEPQELAFMTGGNANCCRHQGDSSEVASKLNILLSYDPAVALLGVLPR